MRLFTALWPPEEALRDLSEVVASARQELGDVGPMRFVPRERWHITLCFHGDDADSDKLVARLRRRMAGLPAPTLRFRSAGMFGGVVWVGVEPKAPEHTVALRALAKAASSDPTSFRAHLTVARWSIRGRPESAKILKGLLAGYNGPWWTSQRVELIRSELGKGAGGGPLYTPVERVELGT